MSTVCIFLFFTGFALTLGHRLRDANNTRNQSLSFGSKEKELNVKLPESKIRVNDSRTNISTSISIKSSTARVAAAPLSKPINSTLSHSGIEGKRVALIGTHFEGNLGDLQETVPLIKRLYSWGVEIDVYLSCWQGWRLTPRRLNAKVKVDMRKYVKTIYWDPIDFQATSMKNRYYDVVIVAPAPSVNEEHFCIGDGLRPGRNVSMVWFGIGVTDGDFASYENEKSCLTLIAAREEVSFAKVKRWALRNAAKPDDIDDSAIKIMLGGDLSFSYEPDHDEFEEAAKLHNKKWGAYYKQTDDWILVFSRFNNFGHRKGVEIDKDRGVVIIKNIIGIDDEYSIEKVVFASSSNLEDEEHFDKLEKEFDIPPSRLEMLYSIEEMWAIISAAPRVASDRYHPGIAALIHKKPLTVINYPNEAIKMAGLYLMTEHGYNNLVQMNENSFKALKNVIAESPLEREAKLTTSERSSWNGHCPMFWTYNITKRDCVPQPGREEEAKQEGKKSSHAYFRTYFNTHPRTDDHFESGLTDD